MIKKIALFFKINSAARKVVIAASLFLIALVYAGAIYGNFGSLLAKSTPLPINLHSVNQANYSQDPAYMQIPPMRLQLVIDAIWDQNPDTQNLSLRLTRVEEIYYANVASITPQPPTSTPYQITDPPLPEILTQTATPSLEVSPSPTNQGPTYTFTPPPPTSTLSPCGSISISNFSIDQKRAGWSINNNSASTITISQINLSWPAGNDSLDKVFFGSGKIWDQTAPPTSVIITSGWTGSSRDIGNGASSTIKFTFLSQALNPGYNISIGFSNGCTVSRSN